MGTERLLPWGGCYNARELGGYPTADGGQTRWKAIVRSDNVGRLTGAGWVALAEYGVRTIIDLRSPSEMAMEGTARPAEIETLAMPLLNESDTSTMVDIYTSTSAEHTYAIILARCRPNFARVVSALATAPPGGVLVHCQAGRDRTGLVCALLLGLAGVVQKVIAEDYAVSERHLQPLYEQLLLTAETPSEKEQIARENRSRSETMLDVLAHLEKEYGGAAQYLTASGVADETLGQLRQRIWQKERGP
jgi:protein tyrosine/serine phosphatase